MLLVVGGHSRKIGKTAVACAIVRALPEAGWTAVKLSPHRHGGDDGGQAYVLREACGPEESDSGRMLAAGAKRALWLGYQPGRLGEAMPALRALIGGAANTLIESNEVMDWLEPDLYLVVMDPAVRDWKSSALRHLGRASALVMTTAGGDAGEGREEERHVLPRLPRFHAAPPDYSSQALRDYLAARLQLPRGRETRNETPNCTPFSSQG